MPRRSKKHPLLSGRRSQSSEVVPAGARVERKRRMRRRRRRRGLRLSVSRSVARFLARTTSCPCRWTSTQICRRAPSDSDRSLRGLRPAVCSAVETLSTLQVHVRNPFVERENLEVPLRSPLRSTSDDRQRDRQLRRWLGGRKPLGLTMAPKGTLYRYREPEHLLGV